MSLAGFPAAQAGGLGQTQIWIPGVRNLELRSAQFLEIGFEDPDWRKLWGSESRLP